MIVMFSVPNSRESSVGIDADFVSDISQSKQGVAACKANVSVRMRDGHVVKVFDDAGVEAVRTRLNGGRSR